MDPVQHPVRVYQGHSSHIHAIFVQGTRLFTASHDHTIREFSLTTCACTRTYSGHTSPVLALFVQHTPPRLYSASADGCIREWDTVTGAFLKKIDVGLCVNALFVTLDRCFVGCGGQPQGVDLPVQAQSSIQKLTGVACVAAGAAASWVGWSGQGEVPYVGEWDLGTGKLVRTYVGHNAPVLSVFVAGEKLYTAGEDRAIREWEAGPATSVSKGAKTCSPVRTYQGHAHRITGIFVQGPRLFSASEDRTVREWDVTTGETIRAYGGECGLLSVFVDGGRVFAGGWDQRVREWDANTGHLVRTYRSPDTGGPISSIFVVNDRLFASSGFDPFGSDNMVKEYEVIPTVIAGDGEEIVSSLSSSVVQQYYVSSSSASPYRPSTPTHPASLATELKALRRELERSKAEIEDLREENTRLRSIEGAEECERLRQEVRNLRKQLIEAWQEQDRSSRRGSVVASVPPTQALVVGSSALTRKASFQSTIDE
ncbi:hypothetical protein SpCBS45565_g05952 [Spizellomyces sp. 'palustris']|nr:hypothetical protein SpCBS45565_g05952 [Spizellomyces sp. 'palustris']